MRLVIREEADSRRRWMVWFIWYLPF